MRTKLLFIFFFIPLQVSPNSLPVFSIQDQYENNLTNQNLLGGPSVLLGCEKEDIEICRKAGRKIYWKMQNLLWKDAVKVKFVAYLNLKNTNQLIEKYILDSKEKQFESIFFDRKGDLETGLKSDYVFLRIYNAKGNEVYREYLNQTSNETIKTIHTLLQKEIQK